MWFGLLGPLQLRSASGVEVPLTGRVQRSVLALLLLSANEPVSTGRLLEALWPDAPAESTRRSLKTHVWAVRRALGEAGDVAGRIRGSPGAYTIHVEEDEVDAFRFVALVDSVDADVVRGHPARAADTLARALGLWRGRVVADLDLDGDAVLQTMSWDEQRLAAVETLAQLELRLCRYAPLVARLRSETAAHPTNEGLWHALILALYRCGRQADALAAFHELRVVLADELGIEPGEPLRVLQEQILRQDPALEGPDPTPAPHEPVTVRSPVPRQLPPAPTPFCGRLAELATLRIALAAPEPNGAPRLGVVSGIGGVGKSALTIHAAHHLSADFPDGQLYVDLHGFTPGRGALGAIEVLSRFLRSLGVEASAVPTTVDAAVALFRSTVADRQVLVLLDNAADAAHVRQLLPAAGGCAVLVTSRAPLTELDTTCALHLPVLAESDAIELIAGFAGRRRVTEEPTQTARIAELCGYLPLALRIAGARLAARPEWPPTELAELLSTTRGRLDVLRHGDLDVRSSVEVGYQAIANPGHDAPLAAAFRLLALFEGPDIGVPATAHLLATDPTGTRSILESLVDASLLQSPAAGRFHMHDLVAEYARELTRDVDAVEVRQQGLHRLFQFYLHTSRQVDLITRGPSGSSFPSGTPLDRALPLTDQAAAAGWLDAERDNLLAVVGQAASEPELFGSAAVGIALAIRFFDLTGRWQDGRTLCRGALNIARRTGDLDAAGRLLNYLAGASYRLGDLPAAEEHLREAIGTCRRTGDPQGESWATGNLGNVLLHLGQPERAIASFTHSLRIHDECGLRQFDRSSVLKNLGSAHLRVGDTDAALAVTREAVDICREVEDRGGLALALLALAECCLASGRPEAAVEHLQEAQSHQRDLGLSLGTAEALSLLGEARRRLGHAAQAAKLCRHAIDTGRRIGSAVEEGYGHWRLGLALRDLHENTTARAHLMRATGLLEETSALEAAEVRRVLAEPPRPAGQCTRTRRGRTRSGTE